MYFIIHSVTFSNSCSSTKTPIEFRVLDTAIPTTKEIDGVGSDVVMDKHKFFIRESFQKEKQILVDPISLKESSFRTTNSNSPLPLPPAIKPMESTVLHPPSLKPPKLQFLSSSLPNSATSSPRFALKKYKDRNSKLPRQFSNFIPGNYNLQEDICNMQRSKSCREGRACALSDEFDMWLTKVKANSKLNHEIFHTGSFSKTESSKDIRIDMIKDTDSSDEGFKCSALCLFLPGFSKGKPDKPRRVETTQVPISRTVSLERFECGSWASSAIIPEKEGDESISSYFDLPFELIRCTVNDTHAPVTTAFMFDDKDRKGVLKNGSSGGNGGKSDISPPRVHFSESSPISYLASPASCITPGFQKAREEFNAFLEAQSA